MTEIMILFMLVVVYGPIIGIVIVFLRRFFRMSNDIRVIKDLLTDIRKILHADMTKREE